jgi:hypothetical protein
MNANKESPAGSNCIPAMALGRRLVGSFGRRLPAQHRPKGTCLSSTPKQIIGLVKGVDEATSDRT